MTVPMQQQQRVFPRWLTASVIVGWVGVTAWIADFVGVTSGLS